MPTLLYVLLPYLILPFVIAPIVKSFGWKKKWTYLTTAFIVPGWPLLLVKTNVLPEDGIVFVGTSVLLIPAILFVQYLANRVFHVRGTSQHHSHPIG